ncbi:MAG: radical SAM protein [Candidatus Omnitrophica bacterium]|nr:radical SAM protein [Candidatus Omnitrophota bacterium]
MKYLYGPVYSRRLGLSLGLNLVPYKVCTFDCVYCQLGKTTCLTLERKEYINIEEILTELKSWFQVNPEKTKELKYITLSGSGEPTLNLKIAQLINQIKKITPLPIAVITNSALLSDISVRKELSETDLILPSLDAVKKEVFERINRPYPDISIEKIIKGLIDLRKEFKGKLWLEVMLCAHINDDLRDIRRLKKVIDEINPDIIHLNSPIRTTTEQNILPVRKNKLKRIKEVLGEKAQII